MKCSTPYCTKAASPEKDRRKTPYCKCCRWKIDAKIVTNLPRDYHRMFINPLPNELRQAYKDVEKMSRDLGIRFTQSERRRLAYLNFEVDHIDGNKNNNHPSNLQTLTKYRHKLKTILNNDQDPLKYKRLLAA